MRCLRRISLGALLACALGRSAFADEATICLASGQLELGRLGPDAQAGTVQFQIEESAGARIEITSGLPDLITSVEGPAGQILNESTIRSFGGEFTAYSSGSQPGLLVLPGLTQGAHQVFTFHPLDPEPTRSASRRRQPRPAMNRSSSSSRSTVPWPRRSSPSSQPFPRGLRRY